MSPVIYVGKKLIYWRNLFSYYRSGKRPWTRGYFEYKWDHIKNAIENDTILQTFANKEKLPNYFKKRIDERIVEYPWVMVNIPEKEGLLLDAGSAFNFRTILTQQKLKNKKITIVTLAPEANTFNDLASYRYEDLRRLSFPSDAFDIITSISTIEHIGMDNTEIYTSDNAFKENKGGDYLKAIQELKRVLKPSGIALITLPFGKYGHFGFFQQFNKEMLEKLISVFCPRTYEITFYKYHDGWQISNADECASLEYITADRAKNSSVLPVAASAVACIKLTK